MKTKNTQNKKRIVIFDLLRVILIFLVVNLHIRFITYGKSNSLEQYVYYTVPLFMVLSFFLMGKYFLKEKWDFKSVLARLKRLLLPLIFWSLVGFITHSDLLNVNNLFLQLISGGVVNLPLYYLDLLIVFTLFFWFTTYIPVRFRFFVYLIIIILATYLEFSKVNYQVFSPMLETIKKCYGRVAELIKYASIGLIFAVLVSRIKLKITFFVLAIVAYVINILTINIYQPPGFNFSGVQIITRSIFVFSLALSLSQLQFGKMINKIIEVLGKYSYGVYLFHFTLIEVLVKSNNSLKQIAQTHSILFLIFVMVLSYILCIVFNFLTRRKFAYLIE